MENGQIYLGEQMIRLLEEIDKVFEDRDDEWKLNFIRQCVRDKLAELSQQQPKED